MQPLHYDRCSIATVRRHIEGPDFRCSIGIRTRELIIGSAPRQVLAAALRWAKENEEVLAATWKELNG